VDESQQEEEMNEMKLAEGVRLLYNKPQQHGRKVTGLSLCQSDKVSNVDLG
jgi:hypothetical protein